MANISDALASELTGHGVDLLRVAEGSYTEVLQLLKDLQKEIVGRMLEVDLTVYQRARQASLLYDVGKMIDDTYAEAAKVASDYLAGVASTEHDVVTAQINNTVGVDIFTASLSSDTLASLASDILVQGAPSADWWAKQSDELIFRFSNQLRLGMAAGETNGELISRIVGSADSPGIMDVSRTTAEALVRTSVQTVANSARLETFKANADVLDGVQQISTLDSRTTEICMAYDGEAWTLDGEPMDGSSLPFISEDSGPDGVPRHWNCRSVLIPIVKSVSQLTGVDGIDELPESTRASMDGAVAESTTFESWFSGLGSSRQDDILGPGKAELFRNGSISMTDLVNQRGRPLTLTELRGKHGL
jgi:hypothetical protein